MSIEQKRAVAMMIGIELWTCKRMQYTLYFFDNRRKTKKNFLNFSASAEESQGTYQNLSTSNRE